DEFSSWYLELVKPAYGQPVDARTYRETLGFFDALLRLLHPFMPFITEELWQALSPRQAGESIMIAPLPLPDSAGREEREAVLQTFERAREVIGAVRTIRLQKNLPNREALVLEVADRSYDACLDATIAKLAHLSEIRPVAEKSPGAVSFLAGTTEYAVPLGNRMNVNEEQARIEAELRYLEGFLASVKKKLGNPKFVANARPEAVDNERKKQADAESKIKTLEEALRQLGQNLPSYATT
ncbi:MAG: class I tRNA ligase family protein, partial [Tannerella sp.]|nr:class I tRNA ligase family protein [Tannerella sp.]